MYMDERIAGKQDGPSSPKVAKNVHFSHSCTYEKLVVNHFPCCTYVSTVMNAVFPDILIPQVSLDFM